MAKEENKDIAETPKAPEPEMIRCPHCLGMGWVVVDVGQLYECLPCNTTGLVEKR